MKKVYQNQPGTWYSDATLQGDYCSTIVGADQINVNGSSLAAPEDILFLVARRASNGRLYLAGQGHASGKCWIYNGSQWFSPCATFGANVAAFDYQDNLLIVSGPNQYQVYNLFLGTLSAPVSAQLGSQGIRYVDSQTGAVVSADSTYHSDVYNLGQYYDLHGVVYGQSLINGVTAVYDKRYQIEPGTDLTILHAYKSDDNLLFVAVHANSTTAVFIWLTVSELNETNFNLEPTSEPGPEPIPPEPIPPEPTPIPPEPIPPTPIPEDPIKPIKEYELMTPETVALIGPGGGYVSVDPTGKLIMGSSKTSVGPDEQFVLSKPDDRFALQPKNNVSSKYLGADATQYDPTIGKQFYLTDNRGNYESWFVGKTPNGLIVAFIEYINQGVITAPFTSCALTVVTQ